MVIEEVYDLFVDFGGSVLKTIGRLAQKGRAVGIHVIMCTQHPSAKILNSFIKANFPTKIAFRSYSEFDSKLVIDNKDARKLVGKGDMLFSHKGEVERVQCSYITLEEINNVCNHIARQPCKDNTYCLLYPQHLTSKQPNKWI